VSLLGWRTAPSHILFTGNLYYTYNHGRRLRGTKKIIRNFGRWNGNIS